MRKNEMVYAEMVKVSPQTAKDWLSKNLTSEQEGEIRNRRKRATVIEKYARRMKIGEWNELNGETIKFDTDGNLIDGQHRMEAQISAGVSLWWLVAFNCRTDAFKTIDDGSSRRGSDMLSIHGEKNVNIFAAVLNMVGRYKEGILPSHITRSMSNSMLYDMATEEKANGIERSVHIAVTNRAAKGFVSPSMVAFVHYMGSQGGNQEKADAFVRVLCSQDSAPGDQPVRELRRRLTENLASPSRVPRITILAWCIKSWNAFYLGETIKKGGLRFYHRRRKDTNGKVTASAEMFPEFANLEM